MLKRSKCQPAIEICNIKKSFIIPKYNNNSLKQIVINGFKRNEKQVHQVLDDISFVINKGDFFGIVGCNGSGKSTLLKTICGVYAPDDGEIKLHGNLTPFIELGVGFNPELSGRDNVFLNGALLGFSRQQMNEMYDEIVEFAELEEFMDLKLKNYSSGMQVRLAFSIAIKAKNDILIFDEVLAVGDESFQRKCLDIFEEYKKNGQTIVLVTHDMGTVKKFCNRAVLIKDGKIDEIGNPLRVAAKYSNMNDKFIYDRMSHLIDDNNGGVSAKIVKLKSKKDTKENNLFGVKEKMRVDIHWKKHLRADCVTVDLFRRDGLHIANFVSNREGVKTLLGQYQASIEIELNVTPGQYFLAIELWSKDCEYRIANFNPAVEFAVKYDWTLAENEFGGVTSLNKQWITKGEK